MSEKKAGGARVWIAAVAGVVGGVGVSTAPPVFVEGEMPGGIGPDICHVERTGFLAGQRVCDLSRLAPPEACDWVCVEAGADGGCAVLDCATPDAGTP